MRPQPKATDECVSALFMRAIERGVPPVPYIATMTGYTRASAAQRVRQLRDRGWKLPPGYAYKEAQCCPTCGAVRSRQRKAVDDA